MYEKQKYLLLKDLTEEDGLLNYLTKNHAVICGGAVRAVFAGEYISDYDIYFKCYKDLVEFEKTSALDDFIKLATTETADTYVKDHLKIQIIHISELMLPNPLDIITHFDYTICMGAFDLDSMEFILHNKFLEHVAGRELCYNIYGKYPLSSLFRLRKYLKKGYTISGTEIIKLGLSINALQMKTYHDLKAQLQGIDTLFLKELTDTLLKPEYAEKEYDFDTFMNLIDSYFGSKLDDFLE